MKIKLDKDPLSEEQNNYLTKAANVHMSMIYQDARPKILLTNFTIKNCLFAATTIVKNSNKERWVYSSNGIGFDRKSERCFGHGYARNNVIFGADTSSSSYIDNCK